MPHSINTIFLHLLLILNIGIVFAVINVNVPSEIDATRHYKLSNDKNYEFMVTLHQSTVSPSHLASPVPLSSLVFYWNKPIEEQLSAQIVHKAVVMETANSGPDSFSNTTGGSGSGSDGFSLAQEDNNYISWICFGVRVSDGETLNGAENAVVVGSKAVVGPTPRSRYNQDATNIDSDTNTTVHNQNHSDNDVAPIHTLIVREEFREQIEEEDYGIALPNLEHNNIKQIPQGNEIITVLKFSQPTKDWGISSTGVNHFFYSIGSNSRSDALFSSFDLDFERVPNEEEEPKSYASKRVLFAHGLFGTAAFALCIPIAFSSAILRDAIPRKWMEYHTYSNIAGGILGLLSFMLALIGKGVQGQRHITDPHHVTGLILILLVLFQIRNGLTRPDLKASRIPSELINDPDRLASKRNVWLRTHRLVGSSVLFLGLYQTGNGLNTFANEYNSMNLTPGLLVYVAITTASLICVKTYLILFGHEIHNEAVTDVEDNERLKNEMEDISRDLHTLL